MAHEILFLKPIIKDYIWGGKRLGEFGYELSSDKAGECWAISAHPNGDCEISGGSYNGKHLSELWKNHRELFGNIAGERFPILTKIIDAESDLSIQVHPDDNYASSHENGSAGKTECWYVLDAKDGVTIVIGHNAKSKSDAKQMVSEKRWKDLIREIPVKKGDFFLINPGTVHAIKGGTLILETQQNSDITYRLYDYGRLSNGKPRELHIEKSLDVITAPYEESTPPKDNSKTCNKNITQLTSCPFFSVWHAKFSGQNDIVQDLPFMAVSVLDGNGTVDGTEIKKGMHFILPHDYGTAHFSGNMELMISSI